MRVLAPGGLLFARLATTVGQPHLKPLGGRYVMPDGATRLLNVTQELGGSLLDPLESTEVHEQRSTGTWVVRKVNDALEQALVIPRAARAW